MSSVQEQNKNLSKNYEESALNLIKSTLGYAKKNLLPYPFYHTTRTEHGVTFTDIGDGTIEAMGTVNLEQGIVFNIIDRINNPLKLKRGKYRVSGCPKQDSSSANSYRFYLAKDMPDGTSETIGSDIGDGLEFTLEEDATIGMYINISTTVTGATLFKTVFRPMITYVSVQDNTYEGCKGADIHSQLQETREFVGITKNNYIPYPYVPVKTENGIFFTDLGDGRILADGTTEGDSSYYLHHNFNPDFSGKRVKLSIKSTSGKASVYFRLWGTGGTYIEEYDFSIVETNGELVIDIPSKSEYSYASVELFYRDTLSVTNDVVEIMIRDASIMDNEYKPYVEDVKTRVDRLYGVEQIWFHDSFTTPTTFKEYYTYTAKKKCIINLTYNAIYNNQPPQHSRINVGSTVISEINDTTPSSHHLLTLNCILNAGDVVRCLSVYKGESSNQIRVVGYVQYLE